MATGRAVAIKAKMRLHAHRPVPWLLFRSVENPFILSPYRCGEPFLKRNIPESATEGEPHVVPSSTNQADQVKSYAVMSSGGKDSTLALDRARRQNLDVRCLVNIYDGPSERVAFHGTRQALIADQAAA